MRHLIACRGIAACAAILVASAYPEELECSRALGLGERYMGKDAAASATFLRVVDAAGTVVPCGSTVAAGTALTVEIDGLDPAVDQYVLEISGASFLSGPCDRKRSNDAAGEIALAAGETASLLGAHAHKYGVVSITESCALTAAPAPRHP